MFVESSQGDVDYGFGSDSQSSTTGSLESWVTWFCSLSGHEYYAEVSDDFMDDDFNLTGLSALVPYYNQALDVILDIESKYDGDEDSDNINDMGDATSSEQEQQKDDGFWKEGSLTKRRAHVDASVVESHAAMLYGMIHQRYLLTRNGCRLMAERYATGEFGFCPRAYCRKCSVIPTGRYDEPGMENVKLYCPSCMDLYNPPLVYQNIDGAHFGTSYSHLMFLNYPQLVPLAQRTIYQPRIFGFRVNERSTSGSRMQWLRMRPPGYTENNGSADVDDDLDEELEEDLEDICQVYQDDVEESKII